MANNIITARLMTCVKTAAEWTSYSVIPLKGELCFEGDTLKFKLGNGTDVYSALPYATVEAFKTVLIDGVSKYTASQSTNLDFIGGGYIDITSDEAGRINITTSGLGDIVTHNWSEISTAITTMINGLDSSQTADAGNVLTGITQVNGKLTSKNQVPYATIAPIQGIQGVAPWIDVSIANNIASIKHIGPGEGSEVIGTLSTIEGGYFHPTLTTNNTIISGIQADSTGHITGYTKLNGSKIITGAEITNANANKIVVVGGIQEVASSNYYIETTLSPTNGLHIPTSSAIANYVTAQLASVLIYKGTIGTGGTVTSLPAIKKTGDTYVVCSAGTYAGKACEVGDYIIAHVTSTTLSDADWDVVNGENQITNSAATLAWGSSSIIANVDGTNITVGLPTNPVTALDVEEAGGVGKYVRAIRQTDGLISASIATLINTYGTPNDTDTAVSSAAITAALATLDHAAIGNGTTTVITKISEANGIIAAESATISSILQQTTNALSSSQTAITSTVNGKSAHIDKVYTDLLKNGDLTLVLDGNF